MAIDYRLRVVWLLWLLLGTRVLGQSEQGRMDKSEPPPPSFVSIDYSRKQVLVEAQIDNGRGATLKGIFLLDTGAQVSRLNAQVVSELKLKVVGRSKATTAGGTREFNTVKVPSLRLGDIEMRGLEVMDVASSGLDSWWIEKGVIGTLGADFLNGKILTIDFGNWRLFLAVRPLSMPGYRRILEEPIKVANGLAFVTCRLPNTKECVLLVDTGSGEGVVFGKDMARFVPLENVTRSTYFHTETGTTPVRFGSIPWIVIGKTLKLSPAVVGLCGSKLTSPLGTKFGVGLLGNELMEKYVLEIDYRRRILSFLQKE
jgi:hypothetical protein